mmetsp:Transcript_21295/g.61527  ORF Transcript_21295/g.61527 Transcript_21295/m.61527 type:complete len:293 (-) Transcript_21295:79-957(-)
MACAKSSLRCMLSCRATCTCVGDVQLALSSPTRSVLTLQLASGSCCRRCQRHVMSVRAQQLGARFMFLVATVERRCWQPPSASTRMHAPGRVCRPCRQLGTGRRRQLPAALFTCWAAGAAGASPWSPRSASSQPPASGRRRRQCCRPGAGALLHLSAARSTCSAGVAVGRALRWWRGLMLARKSGHLCRRCPQHDMLVPWRQRRAIFLLLEATLMGRPWQLLKNSTQPHCAGIPCRQCRSRAATALQLPQQGWSTFSVGAAMAHSWQLPKAMSLSTAGGSSCSRCPLREAPA